MSDSGDNVSLNEGIAMLNEGFIEAITANAFSIKVDLTLFKDLNGKLRATLHMPRDVDGSYECYFVEGNEFFELNEEECASLFGLSNDMRVFEVDEG